MDSRYIVSTLIEEYVVNNVAYDPTQSTLKYDKLALRVVSLERDMYRSLEVKLEIDVLKK